MARTYPRLWSATDPVYHSGPLSCKGSVVAWQVLGRAHHPDGRADVLELAHPAVDRRAAWIDGQDAAQGCNAEEMRQVVMRLHMKDLTKAPAHRTRSVIGT